MNPAERARQIIQSQADHIRRLEKSLDHQNKETTCFRHEAQEARLSERKAWAAVEERDKVLRALNGRVAELEALVAQQRRQLDKYDEQVRYQ